MGGSTNHATVAKSFLCPDRNAPCARSCDARPPHPHPRAPPRGPIYFEARQSSTRYLNIIFLDRRLRSVTAAARATCSTGHRRALPRRDGDARVGSRAHAVALLSPHERRAGSRAGAIRCLLGAHGGLGPHLTGDEANRWLLCAPCTVRLPGPTTFHTQSPYFTEHVRLDGHDALYERRSCSRASCRSNVPRAVECDLAGPGRTSTSRRAAPTSARGCAAGPSRASCGAAAVRIRARLAARYCGDRPP